MKSHMLCKKEQIYRVLLGILFQLHKQLNTGFCLMNEWNCIPIGRLCVWARLLIAVSEIEIADTALNIEMKLFLLSFSLSTETN